MISASSPSMVQEPGFAGSLTWDIMANRSAVPGSCDTGSDVAVADLVSGPPHVLLHEAFLLYFVVLESFSLARTYMRLPWFGHTVWF